MSARDPRRAVIVIPAYDPTIKLVELVEELDADGRTIIVVDDGSTAPARDLFDRIAVLPNAVILRQPVNLGKGGALKSAFEHVVQHTASDAVGVVTADADGQHLAADIRRVAERLERGAADSRVLILGSRAFAGAVPFRSRFGNVLTRGVFKLLTGRGLVDTQTGLRGIPRAFLPQLTKLQSGRYEFELDMLLIAARTMTIEELPIATVYGDFAKSRFRPVRDSLRVYARFLRFSRNTRD